MADIKDRILTEICDDKVVGFAKALVTCTGLALCAADRWTCVEQIVICIRVLGAMIDGGCA